MTSLQKRNSTRSMPLRELTATTASPIAIVAANLMPPEVVAKRRLGLLKRRLGFALVALAALVGLGYALTQQSTSASRDDLASAQSQTSALQRRVTAYADVVQVQAQTAGIRTQLAGIMTGDLQWSALLATLNRVAPSGLTTTDVAGTITASTATSTTPSAPGTDASTVGTLQLSGQAKDYATVAAYVDALGKVAGFSSVEPGSLGNESGHATFTIALNITKAALGGRFTTGGAR